MLSVSEETIRAGNDRANVALYGQEYNDESWAICCSDMLIKDEKTDHIVLGDTLGDGKTGDGFPGRRFHYLLANPPFGVEWKDQQKVVEKEAELGFSGRFGAGLPAINDGSLPFLQHMISKMKDPPEKGGEGSKIAIVFNGSPLFSGDTGSGPSNIRRWIIENDWLDAIVALPDQLFYNTGIFTYVWLVTNRKAAERRGQVQLIDGTRFFARMRKSLNNKRNELTERHITRLTEIYGAFRDGERETVPVDSRPESRVVSQTTNWSRRCAPPSTPMSLPRCCLTCPTLGLTTLRRRSATKYRSIVTFMSISRRVRWLRLKPTSKRLKARSPFC